MPKVRSRTYSRYTREAVALLGETISTSRKVKRLTVQELADKVGVSRGLVQRIEKGDLKCEIGVVFELAAILGIKLFNADHDELKSSRRHTEEKLALLPRAIRKKAKKVVDEF